MPRSLSAPLPHGSLSVVIVIVTLLAGCAEPPSKEMNQAQGAIDAARAAGAEQYAPDELKAAVDALAQSEVAVQDNDYRLALALALDSRESAQNAAKTAVDARARARGDAERQLAEATALLQRADARLKEPAVARLPRRTLGAAEQTLAAARDTLQKARSALEEEEYQQVGALAKDASTEIQATLDTINADLAPSAKGRRR